MDYAPVELHDADKDAGTSHVVHIIMRFLRLLWRQRVLVTAAVAVTCLLGAVYYFTATEVYEAKASVLVLQTGEDVWSTSMTPEGSKNSLIPTYEKILTSQVVMDGAVKRLRKAPAEFRVDLADVPQHRQSNALRQNLTAKGLQDTNIIEIAYQSRHPAAAEAIVDAVVQSYLDFMSQNHKDVSIEILQVLDQERTRLQAELAVKERELAGLRGKVGDLGAGSKTRVLHPTNQDAISINKDLSKIRRERVELEASLAAIQDAIRNGGDLQQHLIAVEPQVGRELVRRTLGLSEPDRRAIQDLERRLFDYRSNREVLLSHLDISHPGKLELDERIRESQQYLDSLQSKLDREIARLARNVLGPALVSMVREKLSRTEAYEQQLSGHYEQAEHAALEVADELSKIVLVEHELNQMKRAHDSLLDQIAGIDMRQNQADLRMAVISEPKAGSRPVTPNLFRVAFVCLLSGFFVGSALVYALDILDDRFRSPEDLQQQLDTTMLAVVRPLPAADGKGNAAIHVHTSPTSLESEAFRTMRTALTLADEDRNRLVLTSAEPGDGKTTVIANLATSFAQTGKETLLIDADLRRPGLSKLFVMRGLPGLSDALRSQDSIEEACGARIQPSGIAQLEILPCGPKPSDPAELLAGARFEDLVAWAEGRYDQVLIDAPPILAASDAAIIGRKCDGIVLIVQPEKNHRRLVLRARDSLASMKVELVGEVANRVDVEKAESYYGYGYGYGYGHSYGDDDEDNSNGGFEIEPVRHDAPQITIQPRRAA